MSEIPAEYDEYDALPPYPDPESQEGMADWEGLAWMMGGRAVFAAAEHDDREYQDASKSLPMFEAVGITDNGSVLTFHTAMRYVKTADGRRWGLEMSGRLRRTKERDDYGLIRFTTGGTTLWVPNLYPFEETTDDGLPVILDRERCEVEITLDELDPDSNLGPELLMQTEYGDFAACQNPSSLMSNSATYNEFQAIGQPLRALQVTYPEMRWQTLGAYLAAQRPDIGVAEYLAMMRGDTPMPAEYAGQFEPFHWVTRESVESPDSPGAFGPIMVPVDVLRRGIAASLIFE